MTPIDARCLWLGALATLLTGTVIAEAPPPPSRPIVLRAAHLFDAVSGKLSNEAVIVIEGGKIKSVGRAAAVPADAQVIDLGDATLLPGVHRRARASRGSGGRAATGTSISTTASCASRPSRPCTARTTRR